VVLSHGNLCSQQAAFAALWPEIGPGDRLAAYLPWHHSFGALAERLWALCRGATLTVVPGGGRDRELLAATLRAVRPTVFMSVPKIHALVMERGLIAERSLRWAFTAGAPLDHTVFRWYQERGIPVHEGWGLTEASPSCTITVPGAAHVQGVVGQPIPGVAVGVRASDGRIFVRGPNVMRGYFGLESPCLLDGMLDSGDLGAWTEAGLHLHGRADHQLKLANGEKVSAATLEAALHSHPAILHAVVAVEGELMAVVEACAGAGAAAVMAGVVALNAAQEAPWQRLAAVYLLHQPMAVENGMLTASLKVSRGRVLSTLRAWRLHGGPALERLAVPR
jgi:long-subunit acyl-CoA synthetase (AMP-forming)